MATWRFLTRTRACATVTFPPDINPGTPANASPDESHDYIIIGAGSAACVLLLEAGPDFHALLKRALAGLPPSDWPSDFAADWDLADHFPNRTFLGAKVTDVAMMKHAGF